MSSHKRELVVVVIEGPPGIGPIIVEGYADSEFITAEKDGDGHIKVVGSHGQTTVSQVDQPGGKITLRLHGGSKANAQMQALYEQRKLDATSFFSISAIDKLSAGKRIHAEQAYIMQVPLWKSANEEQDIEWTIDCVDLEIVHAGR